MKINIKRTYMKEDCTIGCLQTVLSGRYESEFIDSTMLKASSQGGLWATVCDTLEPHAIPWEDKPLIGLHAEPHVSGQTAIPEGTYQMVLKNCRTYKRLMPVLLQVPEFKRVVLRTGKTAGKSGGDILVGRIAPVEGGHPTDNPVLRDSLKTFKLLFALIEEAVEHGEQVWVNIKSTREWTYPITKK